MGKLPLKVKWFLLGMGTTVLVVLLLSAVPYGGNDCGRYQIAGGGNRIFLLDTRTGEIRFCGVTGKVVSFSPFSDTNSVIYTDRDYCGDDHGYEH